MKKFVFSLCSGCLICFFIVRPQAALAASREGLSLWFTQLLPTLLPFCILSYVVLQSRLLPQRFGNWYVILCGFLFGFPIGSKLTADLYARGLLSRRKAHILCFFTNNLSPVFATAAIQELVGLPATPLFYLLLYGVPFGYGVAALFFCRSLSRPQKETASRFHMDMQIMDAGILNGFETLLKLCGYIMLFAILCAMLKELPFCSGRALVLLTGVLEVTNGIAALADSTFPAEAKYVLAVLFLSFGGLCGLFQTASVLKASGLSMKPYLLQKLVVFSAVACGTLLLSALGVLL